jgi:hypothetical protein
MTEESNSGNELRRIIINLIENAPEKYLRKLWIVIREILRE